MAFTVDHSQTTDLKPEGTYETIIEKVEGAYTRTNKPYLNIVLLVRNDVENPTKGGKLFAALWKKKEPNAADLSVDGFSAAQLQAWCKAAQIPNGHVFESLQDLCATLQGTLVRVKMYHDTYNGRTSERIDSFPEPTMFPNCKHQYKNTTAPDTFSQTMGFTELDPDDSDVPF